MSEYDGPTLRSVRESVKIPLRRVARMAGMSHGHLSKVERGEHGRPVTPGILHAYEKATGVRLTDAKLVGFGDGSADTHGAGWRRGRLSDARRRGFNAQVASVAVGGPIGEPTGRLIDAMGRLMVPDRIGTPDVMLVEQAAELATRQDLHAGGGLTSQAARVVLRWAVGLTTAAATGPVHARLRAAIGHLAHRGAWAAFDAHRHDAARSLFTVALDAAVQAGDRDLRAHVLADVGAQHNHLGYPDDCVEIVSMVEGDRRVGPAVRTVLQAVKARAYAAASDLDACRAHLELAERSHTRAVQAGDGDGWRAALCTPAHLYVLTGHAAATLARRSQLEADRADAIRRLTAAVEQLDPTTHPRTRVLCTARLAALQLSDDPDAALIAAKQTVELAAQLRSARVNRTLDALHATATAATGAPAAAGVVELIEAHRREHPPDEDLTNESDPNPHTAQQEADGAGTPAPDQQETDHHDHR